MAFKVINDGRESGSPSRPTRPERRQRQRLQATPRQIDPPQISGCQPDVDDPFSVPAHDINKAEAIVSVHVCSVYLLFLHPPLKSLCPHDTWKEMFGFGPPFRLEMQEVCLFPDWLVQLQLMASPCCCAPSTPPLYSGGRCVALKLFISRAC